MVISGYPSPPEVQYPGAQGGSLSNGSNLSEKCSDMSDNEASQSRSDGPGLTESCEDDRRIKFEDWGFNIDRLFEVAYRFYKRNESKAFHPTFDERNQMNALIMQAKFGNHDSGRAPDVGVLDLVGKKRQYEWSLLKGMSKTEAMTKFICTLDDICPIFKAYAEAVKISSGLGTSSHLSDRLDPTSSDIKSQNLDSKLSETNAQLQSIYTSLCKQTHEQFRKYAEKQHPRDPGQQKYLITSLQEQYYQQYISQMHPGLKSSLPGSSQTSNLSSNITPCQPSPSASELSTTMGEIRPSNEGTSLHAAQNAAPIEQPKGPTGPSTSSVNTEALSGNSRSILDVSSESKERVKHQETHEDNIEADISCEELNTEIPMGPQNNAKFGDGPPQVTPHAVEQYTKQSSLSNVTKNEGRDSEPNRETIVEPVRLFSNADLPPIGMFESFPKPKLIRKATQRSIPMDLMNPNLPSLPPLLPGLKSDSESRETTNPLRKGAETQRTEIGPKHETERPVPPVTQNATYISMDPTAQDETEAMRAQPSAPHLETHHFYQGINLNNGCEVTPEQSISGPDDEQPIEPPEPWEMPDSSQNGQVQAYEPLEPASIWSKGAVAEFKESLGGDEQGGVYEIKESALVIIQVPTYPDGKYIYWEFATDDYDIGFGVDFVYEQNLAQPLALNIYEDNDEDDLEDLIDGDGWKNSDLVGDPESGQTYGKFSSERERVISEKRRRLANTVSIIPTYRRDSHEEVFVGRHRYPGQGYYLLRFDNTYSVLRSKTLYFRICYFI